MTLMATSTQVIKSATQGSVTLVGAGAGDPELLTLKAVRAIANATVILVDDLVNDEVLTHANPQARIVFVGKRGGCKSTPQAFIEQLMVAEYKKGEAVVRLKGGDPMIFGRAGEELAALARAGVPCSVVNGITAGLAAATSLSMPLTHRDYAHGVVFVTGHAAPGGQATDWINLGQLANSAKLTLVVYMGVSSVAEIEQGLLVHMAADTPVALVQNASSAVQRQARTSLSCLRTCLAEEQLASPLLMVIGAVVDLAVIASFSRNQNTQSDVSHVQDRYNARLVA
jgi:uroporphyrin-III C-methyltransferase